MNAKERARSRAPRLTAVAIGCIVFAAGLSACSNASLQRLSAEDGKKTRLHKPLRQASLSGARRRGPVVPAVSCSGYDVAECPEPLAGTLQAYALAGPVGGADRGCLVPAARALLARLEMRFGAVRVVSTCRRGAVIAGTRRASLHRYGKAIDFVAPAGGKAAVVRWLRENSPGVTMTYHGMVHIHTDVGTYRRVIIGAGSRRSARRQSRVSTPAAVH